MTAKRKRNRKQNTVPFDVRLQQAADEAREAANNLPLGAERDALMKKAQQAETVARLNDWLSSPGGLQSPR